MFGTFVAFALMQAAAPAEPAPAAVENMDGWQLAGSSHGCMVLAAYRGGTVLSVFGMPEHGGIGFLLQNRQWTGLKDGGVYPLRIRFADGGDWTIPAVARTEIDADGPGLFFAVPPGELDDGRDFIAEFAEASDMHVEAGGAAVDRLALAGSHEATVALARCMSRLVGGDAEPDNPFRDSPSAASALEI